MKQLLSCKMHATPPKTHHVPSSTLSIAVSSACWIDSVRHHWNGEGKNTAMWLVKNPPFVPSIVRKSSLPQPTALTLLLSTAKCDVKHLDCLLVSLQWDSVTQKCIHVDPASFFSLWVSAFLKVFIIFPVSEAYPCKYVRTMYLLYIPGYQKVRRNYLLHS